MSRRTAVKIPATRDWAGGRAYKNLPKVGKRVYHDIFGAGTVSAHKERPRGHPDLRTFLAIEFDVYGLKELLWSFCKGKVKTLVRRKETEVKSELQQRLEQGLRTGLPKPQINIVIQAPIRSGASFIQAQIVALLGGPALGLNISGKHLSQREYVARIVDAEKFAKAMRDAGVTIEVTTQQYARTGRR